MRKLFLVAAPRSGTTWVQVIATQHPSICSVKETHLFPNYVLRLMNGWQADKARAKTIGLASFLSEEEFLAAARGFTDSVFERIASHFPEAEVVLEKTPGHLNHIATIRALYPDARFLHVLRDPRGFAASHLAASATSWGGWAAKSAFEAAVWWRKSLAQIEEARPGLGGDLMEVRYEDLFVKGDSFLDELAAFMELPPFPERPKDLSDLVPLQSMRSDGPSTARHDPRNEAREGFFRKGDPNSWREELSPEDRAEVEGICHRHMERYGYELCGS